VEKFDSLVEFRYAEVSDPLPDGLVVDEFSAVHHALVQRLLSAQTHFSSSPYAFVLPKFCRKGPSLWSALAAQRWIWPIIASK
jgi:hypothetical protein